MHKVLFTSVSLPVLEINASALLCSRTGDTGEEAQKMAGGMTDRSNNQ